MLIRVSLRGHVFGFQSGVEVCLCFRRKDGSDRLKQAAVVEPVDAFESGMFDGLDALAQMRQWLPGEFLPSVSTSEQVGFEHLGRGAEAEALTRRGVEACAELTELLLGESVRIGVAAEPASETLVGVLDGTFLPR